MTRSPVVARTSQLWLYRFPRLLCSRRSPCTCFLTSYFLTKCLSTFVSCSKVFFEESPNLVPAIDSLFLPITRLVVVEKAVAGFRVHVKLVCLLILLQLFLMLGNLLRGGELVLLAEWSEQRA